MIYCFTTAAGQTVEREAPMGAAPKRVRVEQQWAYRDIAAEHRAKRDAGGNAYPYFSTTLGVNPKDSAVLAKHLRSVGVPTEVNERGQPQIRSREHRNRILKSMGWHDLDGGYGDP